MPKPAWRLTRSDLVYSPIRQSYRFIDRVLRQDDHSAQILKNVTQNEWCMSRSIDQGAIFPPLMLLEVMAQAAGEYEEYLQKQSRPSQLALIRIPHAEFHLTPEPGDQILVTVTAGKRGEALCSFEVKAEIMNRLAARAEIVFLKNFERPGYATPDRP
jgi:3-hydroxymyristoyl/3-hydroxydecanoyl-(acyl carrier protein) dehydratase